ncbi:MAG: hypothetical protein ACYC25_00650 [Paludibacter sp.]
MEFEKNVFVNCPFDEDYFPLLKILLFTIKVVGLSPRLSLERSDSGEVRLHKIKELIESSKYSVHDLSRAKAKKAGEYFRQNMPFELGLDLGCRDYNSVDLYKHKKFLILEEEKYSTQKALSDLSFADCKCHNGDAEELVYALRNWFVENSFRVQSASSIWDKYNFFYADLYVKKENEGFKPKDIDRLPISEFLNYIDEYLEGNLI